MKQNITYFAVFLTTIFAFSSVKAQLPAKVIELPSLEMSGLRLVEAIKEQSDFKFNYGEEVNKRLASKIILESKKVNVQALLAQLKSKLGIAYEFLGGYITLTALHQKKITGKVVNEKGEVISGVTVRLKGTGLKSGTDENGLFSITSTRDDDVLVFSSIGYQPREVPVGLKQHIDIQLITDDTGLNEVVVVGYGKQRKINLTGAVASVNMSNVLRDRPIASTTEALQGAIPGLEIASDSGQPGVPGTTVNIRGFSSINGGTPLVLVDNVPMAINDVNPKDIETVSVLKDAAAASIYGARAAFGVILITTKKGHKNQPVSFTYSNNVTLSKATTLPVKASPLEFITALHDFGTRYAWAGQDVETWLSLLQDYQENPAAYPDGSTTIDGVMYPLADQDLYGKFFQKGFEQLHNFSFNGGSDKTYYRVSLAYDDEDGIMITDKDRYRKYNVNASLGTELTKNLNTEINVYYKNDLQTTPGNYPNVIGRAINLSSYAPTGLATLPDGSQIPYLTSNNMLTYEPASTFFGDDLRLFGRLAYSPLKGFKVTGEYTFDRTTTNGREIQTKNQYMSADTYQLTYINPESSYTRSTGLTNYHALNLFMNYETSFNDHHLSALLGTNQEISKSEGFNVKRIGLITEEVPSVSTSTGTISGGDSFGDYAISGYFARLTYNYKERYLFEANGRYDGSSRFAPGDRFGFFPSVSGGWVVSEEHFMGAVKPLISSLKLRGSWGEIGNQNTGNNYYPYIPTMNPVNAEWIDPGTNLRYLTLSSPTLVSAGFSWETVQTANVGIDLGLFNDRLETNFDLYNRKTLNMLAPGAELPAVLGASAPLQNVADLQTKGWELNISWQDGNENFHYALGFNLSDNKSYITRFNNEAGLISNYYVGQRIGEIWGYTTQGYFTVDDFEPGTLKEDLTGGTLKPGIAPFQGMENKQNPGDIRYVDRNGDGVINAGDGTLSNPGDQRVIGNSERRYQFGLNGAISYKRFDLSFFVQGVGKRDRWLSNGMIWPYDGQFGEIFKHQLDYWTPENPNGFYPRMYPDGGGNTSNSERKQTKYLLNAAYLRIKNINVGYSFPEHWINAIGVKSARIYFSGENLFTFDHMPDGLTGDNVNITSGGSYPFLKKYSFGINVSF